MFCAEPNQEKQFDFAGPIFDERAMNYTFSRNSKSF